MQLPCNLVLILVAFSAIGATYEIGCGDVDAEIRRSCGYLGISQKGCVKLECCYLPSQVPGVPWCFYLNNTFFRTTIQPDDVTVEVTLSRRSNVPDWLKELIRVSKPKRDDKTKEKNSSTTNNALVAEIQDELNCQKTYKLYKKIKGYSSCQVNITQRKPCVDGELPKHKGESECTGCLKLDCCYDPIKKVTQDQRIAPHCFKPEHLLVITTPDPETTTTTKRTVTTSEPRQSMAPTSGRFHNLMNMLGANRNRNAGGIFDASGSRKPFLGTFPGIKEDRRSEANVNKQIDKTKKHKKALLTNQPTMTPDALLPPNTPFHFQTLSTSKQNKKANKPIPNPANSRKSSNSMSPIIKYLLMKNAGMSPSLQDLLPASPQSGNMFANLRKSISNNPLASLYHPKNVQSNQNGINSFNILKHLLNPKKADGAGEKIKESKKYTPQALFTTVPNLLHNKAKDLPINVIDTTGNRFSEANAWDRRHFPALAIELNQETELKFPPQSTCFPKNCGRRTTDGEITQRIVGGQWAGGIEYWPWAASLRRTFTDDDRYTHICGAALISKRWMLTAAHCFTAYEKRGKKILGKREPYTDVYAVYVGQYYRNSLSPTLQIQSLESFTPHPNFDFEALSFDIAVAKFAEPVIFNSYVQPVCLPGKMDPLYVGERGWIVGWGDTRHVGSQNQSKLKELPLPLISTSQCKRHWPQHFHEAWICTEGSYLEDACAGDSGGPLMKLGPKLRWQVIGVAIAGTRQCSTDVDDVKPGIYTKVAYYRDFINSATKGGCEKSERMGG